MALLFFSGYMLTPFHPQIPQLWVMTLGLSGPAALMEGHKGAVAVAVPVPVLPSRGKLPTGALSVPVTGVTAHSQRQMVA